MAVAAALGGAVRVVVSLLVAAAVSAATLHVAARYVLGDVSLRQAALVGPVAPVVVLVVGSLHPLAVLAAVLAADLVAVAYVYDVRYARAGLVAAVHFAVSVLLGIVVASFVQTLSGAA